MKNPYKQGVLERFADSYRDRFNYFEMQQKDGDLEEVKEEEEKLIKHLGKLKGKCFCVLLTVTKMLWYKSVAILICKKIVNVDEIKRGSKNFKLTKVEESRMIQVGSAV